MSEVVTTTTSIQAPGSIARVGSARVVVVVGGASVVVVAVGAAEVVGVVVAVPVAVVVGAAAVVASTVVVGLTVVVGGEFVVVGPGVMPDKAVLERSVDPQEEATRATPRTPTRMRMVDYGQTPGSTGSWWSVLLRRFAAISTVKKS